MEAVALLSDARRRRLLLQLPLLDVLPTDWRWVELMKITVKVVCACTCT